METKRKRPPRLERPKKQYALDQCQLYGVRGIGQLIHSLNWKGSRQQLEDLPAGKGSYKVWKNQKDAASKKRIQNSGDCMRA